MRVITCVGAMVALLAGAVICESEILFPAVPMVVFGVGIAVALASLKIYEGRCGE